MANPRHLELVKRGANATWDSGESRLDLSQADLSGMNLRGVRLHQSNLEGARLVATDLRDAQLQESNLSGASLINAQLDDAKLGGANLSQSLLCSASFHRTTLVRARLEGSNLTLAQFNQSLLDHASLRGAILNRTSFVDTKMSTVQGLSAVIHEGPSELGMHNLLRSGLRLPVEFLRGIGLPESFIDYIPSIIQSSKSFGCYHAEIIADHVDEELATRLTHDLNSAGIRSWLKLHSQYGPQTDELLQIHERRIILISQTAMQNQAIRNNLTGYSQPKHLIIAAADATAPPPNSNFVSFANWLSLKGYRDAFGLLMKLLETK